MQYRLERFISRRFLTETGNGFPEMMLERARDCSSRPNFQVNSLSLDDPVATRILVGAVVREGGVVVKRVLCPALLRVLTSTLRAESVGNGKVRRVLITISNGRTHVCTYK